MSEPESAADHDGNQIIAATPHAPVVRQMLNHVLRVATPMTKSDDGLNLTLLDLAGGLVGYAERLRALDPETIGRYDAKAAGELAKGKSAEHPFSDLDAVLLHLRAECADRYDGWEPLVGKNRHIDAVGASPYPESITGPFSSDSPDTLVLGSVSIADPDLVAAPPTAGDLVKVGVLDTPLYPHKALNGRYIASADALYEPRVNEVVRPIAGHATLIADLILRRAPSAELHVRALLDRDHGTAAVWEAATMMMKFAKTKVDILNISFGCYTRDSRPPLALLRAIELLTPQVLIVAAAGNHGKEDTQRVWRKATSPTWPAAHHDVVAVGAHQQCSPFRLADFSPRVPWIQCTASGVDVAGAFIKGHVRKADDSSTEESDGYARWSGTSFAAATVSGVIAAHTDPGRQTARETLAGLASFGAASNVYAYRP